MIRAIPLNKLVQSPRNVRKHSDAAADAELAASIAALGLLQNLIVRPAARGKFEVEAGERRRRAMLALADDQVLPRDHQVTCLVLEDTAEAAVETSLAENFHRLAMNPADEAVAFASLIEGGAWAKVNSDCSALANWSAADIDSSAVSPTVTISTGTLATTDLIQ